jgi:hypothetical protein
MRRFSCDRLILCASVVLAACAAAASVGALGMPGAALAESSMRVSGPPEIVIYNDETALVREPRTLSLAKGLNQVSLDGVPQRIDSTSVRLRGAGFRVLKQTYRFDLWNGDRVFRRFLGDTIVYRYGGRQYHGLLAGIDGNDLFIQRRDSADVLTMMNRASLSDIEFPAKMRFKTRPSLSWELEADKAGDAAALLSYLTGGIGWTAEYSAILDADEKNVELTGWATIVNRSGSAFDGAKVSLIAGDVHRDGETIDRGASAEGASAGEAAKPTDFFAYHLYPIAGVMDLDPLGTVQAAIVPPTRVSAQRTYRYDGARDGSKVRVQVEFGNDKGSGLGLPLPEGRVRVYAADASGAPTLVGEDRIPHTAAGEHVKILSGVAFDLVGDRSRVSHTRVSRNVTEDQFQIRFRNHGAKAANVTVVENLYGNWEITQKSADFRKKDADTAEFDVSVPAGKESTLTYTVRYTF